MVVAVAVVAVAAMTPPVSSAQTAPPEDSSGGGFDVTAAADGVRIDVEFPPAPLTPTIVDTGLPVAQVTVNGIGDSQGFASAPYPGDTAVNGPSLVAGLVGLPSPPPYPLYAKSQAPAQPESKIEQGAVSLSSKSDETSSVALASASGSSGANSIGKTVASAEARADSAKGELVATATSITESTTFEGVLRIGRVEAFTKVVQPKDGGPKVETHFSAEGVTAAGVTIGVSDQGITLPGSNMPAPDTSGLSPVLDAAGVSLEYAKLSQTAGSIVSAGLVVIVKEPLPTGGDAEIRYTFGRARASASGVAPVGDVVADGIGGSDGVTSGAATAEFGAGAGGSDVGVPGSTAGTPTSTGAVGGARSGAAGPRAQAIAPVRTSTTSAATFYAVLVIGALVAASGVFLIRMFAVRLAWTF